MNKNFKKKLLAGLLIAAIAGGGVMAWQFFAPQSLGSSQAVLYHAPAGIGETDIAKDLKNQGLISNTFFFHIYTMLTGTSAKLQAGVYEISPGMSVAAIVKKIASGDVVKNKITVIEGWDIDAVADYLQNKNIYSAEDFSSALAKDYSKEFDILKTKPKNLSLEGYLFPDTYKVPVGVLPEDFARMALNNLSKKLTPEMRAQITKDKRTIFQIITMASILEKEVQSLEDKKMVAGILWKRIQNGMLLQADSTVNYATGKSRPRVTLAETKIDSAYNTYKYRGLPVGPISNPGLDSIMAAIYPTKSAYWFYLSASGSGQTIYSKTFQEHSASIAKYLNS